MPVGGRGNHRGGRGRGGGRGGRGGRAALVGVANHNAVADGVPFPPPVVAAVVGAGGGGRGRHWREAEVALMLSVVRDILPRGANEWMTTAIRYNERCLQLAPYFPERDDEAIRNKFKALKNTRKPTGDPECPPHVREAKYIQRDIEARMSVANIDDDIDADDDDDDLSDSQMPYDDDDDVDDGDEQPQGVYEDEGLQDGLGGVAHCTPTVVLVSPKGELYSISIS